MTGSAPLRVLVTGAEERQGLGVIRGLGRAGATVIACGTNRDSLGFSSRYAAACRTYTSPLVDRGQCEDDLIQLISRYRPDVVIPSVESTLVILNQVRTELEQWSILAAPPADTLEYALDKSKTLRLAERLEVPVPTSIEGNTIEQILAQASEIRFPVAVKPRGPRLHPSTAHHLELKVGYAQSVAELRNLLEPVRSEAGALLVQEFVPGVGRCVAAVCNHGDPVVLFAYSRLRELPHTGGVSVVRRSESLDERLKAFTTALLGAIRWHGVAMVEFRYDRRTDRFTLMEVNGRFQTSVALSLDAGLNLPYLVACAFTGRPLTPPAPYRIGVTERWVRGDLLALTQALSHTTNGSGTGGRRWRLLWEFARDFRPGVRMDEFKWWDWRPGALELRGLLQLVLGWSAGAVRRVLRYLAPRREASLNAPAAAVTQDSIRA